jgi:hypothetical protein
VATTWTAVQQAEFLVCLPVDVRTLDFAESMGRETEREYWRQVYPLGLDAPEEVERATRKLLEHGRPFTAVDFLAAHPALKRLPQKLIADALELVGKTPSNDDPPPQSWSSDFLGLLDLLGGSSEVNEERLLALELAWLPLFEATGRPPKILHRELARNPESFAEVVAWVYRQDGKDASEVSEDAAAQAQRGLYLLESGLTVPGTTESGTIDAGLLNDWVRQAREATAAKARRKGGDRAIGYLLSGSSVGTDGIWPHEAVRQVIEETASEDLEYGFERGVYGSRGVTAKTFGEGGEQERELAARYAAWAGQLRDRWHRTAEVLRRVEDWYLAYARHEDRTAEEDLEL